MSIPIHSPLRSLKEEPLSSYKRKDPSAFGFFFQAEDGIRYADVTGVQTCALPIFPGGKQACRDQQQIDRVALAENKCVDEEWRRESPRRKLAPGLDLREAMNHRGKRGDGHHGEHGPSCDGGAKRKGRQW